MGLNRKLLVFGFSFSSIGGPLALVGQFLENVNPFEVVLSVLIFSPITFLVYYSMNKVWDKGGLYDYVVKFTPKLSSYFLYFWFFSYFLYLSYTVDYIVYYILNLDGFTAILLTIGIAGSIAMITLLDRELEFLFVSAIIQMLFILPINWHLKFMNPYELSFTNILSTSLLYICITLTPFIGNGSKEGINSVILAYLITGAILFLDSFFNIPKIIYLISSFSTFSLIVVEFYSLKSVLSKFSIKSRKYLVLGFLGFTLTSLINPYMYYIYTIVPSLTALYISLIIFFISMTFSIRNELKLLGFISLGLIAYGLYSSLQLSSYYLLLEQIIIIIIIGVIPLLKNRLFYQ
ncbi:hypothetical protein SULI_02590 [Saccharolobus solfataricus]|uniref:Uncharacterized protein n=3 Tax=Saccharolobus solfataricus TaxID=2287 RepID=Q97VD0_SACS2|nr:hypothetical protein [Saccharolobus solfataricus]AAK42814.1 Hypothetical protein SSO2702 [Saccharolobus solfataricus P2]AKA72908.1 hypothetical protein SULB_0506 [Saccharolobus solfataricus]AKA75607.1 hypothetical protein SULC_0504 [Saccharolobus solfataricus]AKA78300.1 hypothetical protein SULA_0504 [Saccharolobus solfataricus]AZF67419.1 hypothetical protein SULG_02590 [Saccharolobus solfataricus]